jgi:Excalibur calcium-binding domain
MTTIRPALALVISTTFAALAFTALASASPGVVGFADYAASDRPTVAGSVTRIPPLWRSCTNYNKRYPHGVGRLRARDRTSGGTPPVTTFRRSTRIYNIAMGYNRGLDRDKDGVACEKR